MTRNHLLLAALAVAAACHSAPSKVLPDGTGFTAEYGKASSEFEEFRSGLISNRFLDTISARLNDSLRIPEKITLKTAHCDSPISSYEESTHTVILCYEFFQDLANRFALEPGGEYLVSGTIVFALMHELGHALVDVLKLPITGREEDAVDQLAIILMLQQGTAGDSLAFGAVGWFATRDHSTRLDSLALADDHALNLQRVYNMVCWIYGRDPGRYPQIISKQLLPEDRRERCPAEYQRLTSSWGKLLAPYKRSG